MKIVYIGRNRKGGFTLVETLVTVSIIVILLAVGIAGIHRYRNYLRITELDNMARSIYMAAQNRAVLLDNDRRFQTLVKGTPQADGTFPGGGCTRITLAGLGKERWYIDSKTTAVTAAALDDLLPTGTIDPALWDGRFYIVYEPDSASVTDVFYMEQDYDLNTYAGGIAGALGELGADDKRDKRMEHKPMIGWFGGNAGAPRGEYLEEPTVKVLIVNKEELTLQVTFEIPEGVSDVDRVPSVTLKYGGHDDVDLLTGAGGGRLVKKDNADITNRSVREATYTWVLDSLGPDSGGVKRGRFKELFTGGIPPLGGEFTVIAGLTLTASDGSTSSFYAEGADNSLFAGVNEVTAADGSAAAARSADIKYLRHLQNLDMLSSGVTPRITMAKQTQNIEAGKLLDNAGAEIKDSYEFTPIQNEFLSSCSAADQEDPAAGSCVIENLKVTPASTGMRSAAGLFGEVKGADGTKTFLFQNIRLIDPKVAGGDKNTGALVGSAENVRFENCQVVNTDSNKSITSTGGIAGGLAGTAENASFKNCKASGIWITGNTATAGGLAGSTKNAIFTDCSAGRDEGVKSEINGQENAGGMVGTADGSLAFKDCLVFSTAVNGSAAGGLLGAAEGAAAATFTDCTVGKADAAEKTVTVTTAAGCAGGMAGNITGGSFIGCLVVNTEVKGTGAGSTAGGMAGKTNGVTFGKNPEGAVKKCSVEKVAVTAEAYAGGMLGADKSTAAAGFERCEIEDVTVESTNNTAGGLLGYKGAGAVEFHDCTVGQGVAAITVIGGSNAGGMLGAAENATAATFADCKVGKADAAKKTVTVTTATGCAGGMAGNMTGGSFIGCLVVNTEVKGTGAGSTAGGMAGKTNGVTFGKNAEGTVKKCSVEKVAVTAEAYAGGMLGAAEGAAAATFTDCTVGKADAAEKTVTVTTAAGCAGGMAGNMAGGSFIGCLVVNTKVEGTGAGSMAGGMAGKTNGVTFGPYRNPDNVVKNCSVEKVAVEAVYIAGGMAGHNWGAQNGFEDCQVSNTAITCGKDWSFAGGISGFDESSNISFVRCKVKGVNVSALSGIAGGMMGCKNAGSVAFTDCTVGEDGTGTSITGRSHTGGMLGWVAAASGDALFTNCKVGNADEAITVVSSDFHAGGLLGCAEGTKYKASFTGCTVGKAGAADKKVTVTTATGCAGGMAGNITDGSFIGCQVVSTKVEGTAGGSIAGGLAGGANQVTFEPAIIEGNTVEKKCRVENVTVNAKKCSGGMAGVITAGGSFNYCEVVSAEVSDTGEGKVTDSSAGGMAGDAGSAGFDDCVVREITVTTYGLAGGLAGAAGSSYSNCQVSHAAIEGKREGSYAGGLAGDTGAKIFTGCTVGESGGGRTTVTANLYAGGLTGNSWGGAAFSGCQVVDTTVTSTASPDKMPYAGGLTGASGGENVSFEKCRVRGDIVIGSYCAGGMAGHNYGSAVKFDNCGIKRSTVTANGASAGGLLAYKGSAPGTENVKNVKFTNCTVGKLPEDKDTKAEDVVTITAQSRAGGLLGYVDNGSHAIFEGCQAVNATVTANDSWDASAGGLAGKTGKGTQFIDCTAGGEKEYENISVTALIYAGGLSGASVDSSFSNCQAVNATVIATAWNGRAGGLAGRLVNYVNTVKNDDPTKVSNCKVYWTHSLPATTNDLQKVDYKIRAEGSEGMAGGLVGETATAKAIIQNSFAAAFVYGGGYVGGLIGYLPGQVTEDQWGNSSNVEEVPSVSVEKSYADCYIMLGGGTGWYAAGGLVGSNVKAELTMKDVYAAGFITIIKAADKGNFSGDYAAGLCGGNAELKVENAYAAMHYDQGGRIPYIFPLAMKATAVNSAYLHNSKYVVTAAGGYYVEQPDGTPYGQMANLDLGAAFVKLPSETHPYNIDGAGRSGSYPFPGLKGLTHYGDWVTQAMASTADLMDEESLESDETATVSDNDMTKSDNDMTVSGGDAVSPDNGDTSAGSGNDMTVSGSDAVSLGNGDTPAVSGEDTKPLGEENDPDKPTDTYEPPEGVVPPKNGEQMSGDETDDESGESGSDMMSNGGNAASVSGNNSAGGGDTS